MHFKFRLLILRNLRINNTIFYLLKCWGIYDQLVYLLEITSFCFLQYETCFPVVKFNGILNLFYYQSNLLFWLLWISMHWSKAAVHEDTLNGNYYWTSSVIFCVACQLLPSTDWWLSYSMSSHDRRLFSVRLKLIAPFCRAPWIINWNLPLPSGCFPNAVYYHPSNPSASLTMYTFTTGPKLQVPCHLQIWGFPPQRWTVSTTFSHSC